MAKSKYIILTSSLSLLFLSMFLFNVIMNMEGMTGAFYIVPSALLIVFLGVVISTIFYRKQIITQGLKGILIALTTLVVIPLVMGPIIMFFVTVGLGSYYTSEGFVNKYVKNLGVIVKPKGQEIKYSHCKMIGFSSSYIIDVARETELIFALDYLDISYANQFGNGPSETLKSKFTFVDKIVIRGQTVHELGIFRVPAGKHEITLSSSIPFLLVVYDNNVLLDPSMVVNRKYARYPKIYSDNYIKQQFDLETQDIKDKSCSEEKITPITGDDYFLNDKLFIPNAQINIYDKNYPNHELYLYDEHGLGEILLLQISAVPNDALIFREDKNYYKKVLNKYSGEYYSVYFSTEKKYDPHRPPYLGFVNFNEFVNTIQDKPKLLIDDQLYLNRTDSYFWIDGIFKIDDFYLNFNSKISPYTIDKIIEVVENIEPSRIYVN